MKFTPIQAIKEFIWNDHTVINLMRLAYRVATKSPERTQNGAVIVGETWSEGFNQNLWPTKAGYDYVVHAEEDAILKYPVRLQLPEATLVCPWLACPSCARKIVRVGIKNVWRHADRTSEELSNDWWNAIQEADEFLINNGVVINEVVGPIVGAESVKIRNHTWNPETLELTGGIK